MSKRVLLVVGLVFFGVVAIAGVTLYKEYLAADRLVPIVRQAIEEALGQPIDLEDARVVGIGTVAFGPIRIPAREQGGAEDPWFMAESARVRLGLAKLIARRDYSLEVDLDKPVLSLRNDPNTGWNFLPRERPETNDDRPSDTTERPSSRDSKKKYEINLRMKNPVIRISEADRGECGIEFEDEALFGIRSDEDADSKSIRIFGKGKLEGELGGPMKREIPRIAEDLISAVGTSPNFKIGLEASLHGDRWEIASRNNPGLILESNSNGLTLSRFRFSGARETAGTFTLDTAAIEAATFEAADWNHPAIERLKVPWTRPPLGPLTLGIRDLQADRRRIACSLSGIHIQETTLSIESLPWLEVLTPETGWKLVDVDLSCAVEYSISEGTFEWNSGRIEFQSGRGGRIDTSGLFRSQPQVEWTVKATLHDFPVPHAFAGNSEVSPGILSGEMTWVETRPVGASPVFVAEGAMQLRGGEIGAIRLFGGLDDLLDKKAILQTPFDRFGFGFHLSENRIALSDLLLESDILHLSGKGSYGPARSLDMELEIHPTPKLAETLENEKESLFFSGIANSKDPVQVRATGDLDNLEYSITFGAGVKIPIQGLGIQF